MLVELPWPAWILPVALVVTWIVLWSFGSRRARLAFAALSIVGVVATCALGMYMLTYDGEQVGTTYLQQGGDDGSFVARSLDSISNATALVGVNSVLGLIVNLPLATITALVDLARSRPPATPDPRSEKDADELQDLS